MASQVESLELPDFPLWERAAQKHIPFSFDIELTERCNCNCRHCYINLPANDRTAKSQELTSAEIRKVIDQAVELGSLWCLMTGGEPLLREDFAEIYLYAKKKGLLVSVFTNATLVDDKFIELIKRYPPRDLEVSVYGVTRETYERVTRVPGSFEAFSRGVRLLQEAGVPTRYKAIAMRSNVHELDAIRAFCVARTKDYFRFDPFLHLRLHGEPERNANIQAERLSPEEVVAVEMADQQRKEGLTTLCKTRVPYHSGDGNTLLYCGAGLDSFSVNAYGKFQLCSTLTHPDCVYDLRTGTLREAWEKFVPRVRALRSKNPETLGRCLQCPIVNICMWCSAQAYLEYGDLDQPVSYYCQIAHARARAMGLLKEGEQAWRVTAQELGERQDLESGQTEHPKL